MQSMFYAVVNYILQNMSVFTLQYYLVFVCNLNASMSKIRKKQTYKLAEALTQMKGFFLIQIPSLFMHWYYEYDKHTDWECFRG